VRKNKCQKLFSKSGNFELSQPSPGPESVTLDFSHTNVEATSFISEHDIYLETYEGWSYQDNPWNKELSQQPRDQEVIKTAYGTRNYHNNLESKELQRQFIEQ
jgi:hypothetical protein